LVIIESLNEQGHALRLHREAAIAAVELPVPRGKLKNRINTFLKNPLCRGVDELSTKQLESRCLLFAELEVMEGAFMKSNSDNLEHCREMFELKKENSRLKKEKIRQDMLLFYYTQEKKALMYYNELQSRSAEVEAMQMNFEQRLAGAVAKARLRAKPEEEAEHQRHDWPW
jgi:hypothetical protein